MHWLWDMQHILGFQSIKDNISKRLNIVENLIYLNNYCKLFIFGVAIENIWISFRFKIFTRVLNRGDLSVPMPTDPELIWADSDRTPIGSVGVGTWSDIIFTLWWSNSWIPTAFPIRILKRNSSLKEFFCKFQA